MKKTLILVAALLINAGLFAQAPQKMSYQAVIRNTGGLLVTNQSVGIQLSILQGTPGGTAVYVETHTLTTNGNGLASLQIGTGTVVTGSLPGIDWSNGPYFLKTETDPTGGTNYTITGNSELQSVPYALFAGNNRWVEVGSDIHNSNSGNVGIGTASPSTAKLVISGTPAAEGLDLSSTDQYANMRVIRNSLSGIDNDMHIGFGSGAVSSLHLYSDNTETITIAGGKAGVGTALPQQNLSVQTGLNIDQADANAGTLANTLSFGSFSGEAIGSDRTNATANPHGLDFYTANANRMSITSSGNVGIGTLNPAALLHVLGSTIIGEVLWPGTGKMQVWNSNSGTSALEVIGSDGLWTGPAAQFWTQGTGPTVNIDFGGSGTNKLVTFQNFGNEVGFIGTNGGAYFSSAVGIGTNAPGTTLEVVGGGKISGGYVSFCTTNDNSSGNVGMGFGGYNNAKLTIQSTQDFGLLIEAPTSPVFALYVNGEAAKPGGASWVVASDARLKENVKQYQDGLSMIQKINPVTFHYNEQSGYNTSKEYVGVIAQELKEVAPYMVGTFKNQKDKQEYLDVDNNALTYMLVNAVKEQQQQIEDLKKEILELKRK